MKKSRRIFAPIADSHPIQQLVEGDDAITIEGRRDAFLAFGDTHRVDQE